jgi:hypothetical protein
MMDYILIPVGFLMYAGAIFFIAIVCMIIYLLITGKVEREDCGCYKKDED